MFPLIITVFIVFAILLVNEWWWRDRTHGEISRKFVHITVGTFVAIWPLFLTWRQIELLSLAFVVVVLASLRFDLFKAIHSVQRPTLGEIYFALAVGMIAFITNEPAIYAVALLHMSLADGMAAIVGVKYGASRAYSILGSRKSFAGSATFFMVSILIFVFYSFQQHIDFNITFVLIAVGATMLENIAVKGLDNLLIPALVAFVLGR